MFNVFKHFLSYIIAQGSNELFFDNLTRSSFTFVASNDLEAT